LSLINVETIIRGSEGRRQSTCVENVVLTKMKMTIEGSDSVEVTAGREDTRLLVQINLLVWRHHDQIDYAALDLLIPTLLTELDIRAWSSANRRALMITRKSLLAADGARNPVARSSAWHTALAVRAGRSTTLLSTWRAWLRTLLRTLRVAAPDFTRLITETTVSAAMACVLAAVRAVRKVTAACLTTFAMVFLGDQAVCPSLAVIAVSVADMSTF
jgi:hypothetical protein